MEQGNKIALVTGGSRGLGKNMVLNLADQGTDIVLTYLSNEEAAMEVVAEIVQKGRKAVALQLDSSDVKTFEAFFTNLRAVLGKKWERENFDFLINNAGTSAPSAFAETTESDFDSLVNIHFKGVYFLSQSALPFIADGGRIINLSTGLTRFATPGYAAYASMKGAIEVLTKYMAKELGPRRINVNMVAPGIIHTDFTRKNFEAHPQLEEYMSSITALGRVGEPQDIGAVVAFLCSEGARWINAQRIEASGGMFL